MISRFPWLAWRGPSPSPAAQALTSPAGRRNPARIAAGLAALWLAAPPAPGQQFLYVLNEAGQVTVNATLLEKLPGQFNPAVATTFGQAWWDIAVDGSDRYALRLDGKVQRNGEPLESFEFTSPADVWASLALMDGHVWALRTDGTLGQDGVTVQNFPVTPPQPDVNPEFFFLRLVAFDGHLYSLRSDGSVFRDSELTPVVAFDGGPGVVTKKDDGLATDTIWRAMEGDPTDGQLYALRNDGRVMRATPAVEGEIPGGSLLANLPFDPFLNTQSTPAVQDELYTDIVVRPDGTWAVINGRGELFAESHSLVSPLIDFAGSSFSDLSQVMIDVMAVDERLYTLRFDGKVFRDGAATTLVSLGKGLYRKVVMATEPPDLTHFKNASPVVTRTSTTVIGGDALTLDVIANDSDKLASELVFAADPVKLPEGATFDARAHAFSWTAPELPGSYTLVATVSDGTAKPVVSKNKVKAIAPDTDRLKNKPPRVAKIKGARALVGVPYELAVHSIDPDGDALTLSVNADKPPFTLGASFDPETRRFSWTPTLEHIGTYKLVVQVADGAKVVKRSIKLKVEASLLAF